MAARARMAARAAAASSRCCASSWPCTARHMRRAVPERTRFRHGPYPFVGVSRCAAAVAIVFVAAARWQPASPSLKPASVCRHHSCCSPTMRLPASYGAAHTRPRGQSGRDARLASRMRRCAHTDSPCACLAEGARYPARPHHHACLWRGGAPAGARARRPPGPPAPRACGPARRAARRPAPPQRRGRRPRRARDAPRPASRQAGALHANCRCPAARTMAGQTGPVPDASD